MYIDNRLDDESKQKFIKYLDLVKNRLKIFTLYERQEPVKYKWEVSTMDFMAVRVDEYFKNEDDLTRSGRRPLEDGYEKSSLTTFRDGTLCVKSIFSLPFAIEDWHDPAVVERAKLIIAYMNYPKIREHAPNILKECIPGSLHNKQIVNAFGFLIPTYEAILYLRKEFEKWILEDNSKILEKK